MNTFDPDRARRQKALGDPRSPEYKAAYGQDTYFRGDARLRFFLRGFGLPAVGFGLIGWLITRLL